MVSENKKEYGKSIGFICSQLTSPQGESKHFPVTEINLSLNNWNLLKSWLALLEHPILAIYNLDIQNSLLWSNKEKANTLVDALIENIQSRWIRKVKKYSMHARDNWLIQHY